MAEVTCAFTGHRPKSFPWGYNESAPGCVLDMRKKNPALKLHAILPCEGQESKWSAAAQALYRSILEQADEVVYVNREYSANCMLERNRYMVDRASILLAVYNGAYRSGTGMTMRYAQKLGREIIVIDPISRNISYQGSGHI